MTGPHPHTAKDDARDRLQRFLRIRRAEALSTAPASRRPALTLSREAGIPGLEIARRLVAYLENNGSAGTGSNWASVDAGTIDHILEHLREPASPTAYHHDSGTIVPIFPAQKAGDPTGGSTAPAASEHPSAPALRRFADLGNTILVGRGSHLACARLDHVFRVRLIADRSQRIGDYAMHHGLASADEAATAVDAIDASRQRFVADFYQSSLEDPHHYDLIINMSRTSSSTAVHLIGDSLLEWAAAASRHQQKQAHP